MEFIVFYKCLLFSVINYVHAHMNESTAIIIESVRLKAPGKPEIAARA